jgi:hypothetical protein
MSVFLGLGIYAIIAPTGNLYVTCLIGLGLEIAVYCLGFLYKGMLYAIVGSKRHL